MLRKNEEEANQKKIKEKRTRTRIEEVDYASETDGQRRPFLQR